MIPETSKTRKKLENRRQEIIDMRLTFGSETGRRVLERLKHKGCFNRSTAYNGRVTGALDVNKTLINEGMRNLVLFIMSEMSQDPDQIAPPRKENRDG